MAQVIAAHVEETGTANGTTSFAVTAATPGNRRFNAFCAAGDTFDYSATDASGNWEDARGTYSAANTITRPSTVECGSNGTSPVTFAGAVTVTLSLNAATLIPYPKPIVTVSGARTISAADGKAVLLTSDAAAVIHTLPDLAVGTEVNVIQGAAGVVTFAVGASGVLRSLSGHSGTAGLYARARALQLPYATVMVGGSSQFLYNWNPSTQFIHASAAATRAIAKTGTFRVAVAGDSTTAGVGAAASNYRPLSSPSYTASNLATYAPALVGSAAALVGSGNDPNSDSRITFTGNASFSGPTLFGGPGAVFGASDGISVNFGSVVFDTVRIVYVDQNQQFTIALDGAASAFTSFQSGVSNNNMNSHVWTVPRGTHTVQVPILAGVMYLQSLEVWDSTQAGLVQVLNGGSGGALSAVLDTATPVYGYLSGLLAEQADLAIIDFGINDMTNANLTASQYQTNITNAVTLLQAQNCDVLLVMPEDVTSTNFDSVEPSYLAALQSIATSKNVPVLDMCGYFGPRANMPSAWIYDNLHSTSIFYNLVGQLYAKIIAVGTGRSNSQTQSDVSALVGTAGSSATVPVWHLSGDLA